MCNPQIRKNVPTTCSKCDHMTDSRRKPVVRRIDGTAGEPTDVAMSTVGGDDLRQGDALCWNCSLPLRSNLGFYLPCLRRTCRSSIAALRALPSSRTDPARARLSRRLPCTRLGSSFVSKLLKTLVVLPLSAFVSTEFSCFGGDVKRLVPCRHSENGPYKRYSESVIIPGCCLGGLL
jgi:hypothetical protein